MTLIEKQHPIIENVSGSLLALARVKLAKSHAAIGIGHGLQIDSADAFQPAHVKGVLAQQIPGIVAFHMALGELRVSLLQQLDLLLGEFKALGHGFLLQAQKLLVFGFQALFEPHIARLVEQADTRQQINHTEYNKYFTVNLGLILLWSTPPAWNHCTQKQSPPTKLVLPATLKSK